jgi:hypothetical protein
MEQQWGFFFLIWEMDRRHVSNSSLGLQKKARKIKQKTELNNLKVAQRLPSHIRPPATIHDQTNENAGNNR